MKMNVLLVDDEQKFGMMLAKRLALRNVEVDFVNNGLDAIQKATQKHYDVTILDVKMPGISGIELKHQLELLVPETKIIFLTGHGSKDDFEKGTAEGAVYLGKPLQIERLVKKLHELSGR